MNPIAIAGTASILNSKAFKYVLVAIVVLIIFFVVWDKFGKSKEETKEEEKKGNLNEEINKEINKKNITLSQVQLNTLADKIFKAVSGIGTDERSILDAFRTLKTTDDVLALIKTFGVRDTMTLREWLYDDLSNSEISKINDIFLSKGISFSF